MSRTIRIVQFGLGPVGQMLTPFLLERNTLAIVGAVDIDPTKAGKDLGEVCGLGRTLGVKLTDDAREGVAPDADVALITTSSSLAQVLPTIEFAIEHGMSVVSTCEELAFPWKRQLEFAKKIDSLAKSRGVAVLGTGVNPGFLMDCLAVVTTGICRAVQKVTIERFQDASKRRIPFQKKIGVGMSPDEFRANVKSGKMGHVGLTESMHMVASRLGWDLTSTEDKIEPVESGGKILGLYQRGKGLVGSREVLTLEFRATLNEPEPRDRIQIEGTPSLSLMIPGGVNGDIATCAIVTNAIPVVLAATPGLRTMVDLAPISCYSSPPS